MTATREELLSLIGRLEAATEDQLADPDWLAKTRSAIADACFERAKPEAFIEPHWWFSGWAGWEPLREAPDWLGNTDAALTLRPSGWLLTGLSDGILDTKYRDVRRLTKWLVGMAPEGAVINAPDDFGQMVSAMALEPAPAAVIACLKARAKLMESTP